MLPQEAAAIVAARLAIMKSTEPDSFEYLDSHQFLLELLAVPWGEPPVVKSDPVTRDVFDLGVYGPQAIPDDITDYVNALTGGQGTRAVAEWPVPILLGPAGVGKRTMARKFGQAMGRPVEIIQMELTDSDSDLFGFANDRVRGRSGAIYRALRRAEQLDAIVVLAGFDWAVRAWQDHGLGLLKFLFDPNERYRFRDRFLDVEMNISQVLFILTAGGLEGVPVEFFSRVFAVEWAGYTNPRKVEISSAAILPKLRDRYSLTEDDFMMVDSDMESLIEDYTNDAGMEQVEIVLDILCRKAAAAKSVGLPLCELFTSEAVHSLLGPPRRYGYPIRVPVVRPGIVKGLAMCPEGALVEVIEVAVVPGAEGFGVVGSGNEMIVKMVDLAYHHIRSRMTEMDISARQLYEYAYRANLAGSANEISAHSLGLAIVVAFLSQIRDRVVDPELALVGEITLNGSVIGGPGMQHMLLSAYRNGIRRLVVPGECREDLVELPSDLGAEISIIEVDDVEQAIRIALE